MCIYVRTVKNCDSIQNWMHRTRTVTLGCNWIFTPHNLLLPESASNQRHGRDTPPFWAIEKHLHPFPPRVGWYAGYVFLPNIHISPPRDHHHPRLCAHRPWLSCSRRWPIKVPQRAMTSTANAGGVGRWSRGCVGWHFQVQFHLKPKKTPVFPVELSSDPKFSE